MNPGHVLLTVQDTCVQPMAGIQPLAGKQQLACQIKRVIPGEVHFLSSEPVSNGSLAEAEFDDECRVSGKIVGCLKSGEEYLLSFQCDTSERRQDQRFPLNQPAWLLPSLAPDSPQVSVLLRDVSRNGVGVDVPDL